MQITPNFTDVKPLTLISPNRVRNAGCKMNHTVIDSLVHHPLKRHHSLYCISRWLLQHIVEQCLHEDLGTSLGKLLQIQQVKSVVCSTTEYEGKWRSALRSWSSDMWVGMSSIPACSRESQRALCLKSSPDPLTWRNILLFILMEKLLT